MIIADENIEQYWIELLRKKGYTILSIRENHSGISDKEVIKIVQNNQGLLITEDKDFGELIFSYGYTNISYPLKTQR